MKLSIPRPGTSDVIRCVIHFESVYFLLTELCFCRFYAVENSSDDELSINTICSGDVESLQLAVEMGCSFKLDRSALSSRVVVEFEGDVAVKMRTIKMVYALRPLNFDSKTRKQSLIGELCSSCFKQYFPFLRGGENIHNYFSKSIAISH